MSDFLAGMIARSEHTEMNQSLPPVLDFDRRGYADANKPGWFVRHIGLLFQWVGSTLISLGERMSREEKPTISRDIPLSHNG